MAELQMTKKRISELMLTRSGAFTYDPSKQDGQNLHDDVIDILVTLTCLVNTHVPYGKRWPR